MHIYIHTYIHTLEKIASPWEFLALTPKAIILSYVQMMGGYVGSVY